MQQQSMKLRRLLSFEGDPQVMGKAYGATFAEHIVRNTEILVSKREQWLPRRSAAYRRQVRRHERMLIRNWPWLIEEINAVAEATGQAYADILELNLRVWHFPLYYAMRKRLPAGAPVRSAAANRCSSMAVRLADKTMACAGALDDTQFLYDGPLRFVPRKGFRFITFPIIGTSWGNRGLNSAGLALGESSQGLSAGALLKSPREMNADLALRVILQTCATVREVREFCRRHPFNMNTVAVDAQGDVFCAHQTVLGCFEIKAGPCAITNHFTLDEVIFQLRERGVTAGPESPTTRLRRGRMIDFIGRRAGRCTAAEVRALLTKGGVDASSLCPKGNVALTYANPQAEPGVLWVAQPRIKGREGWQRLLV